MASAKPFLQARWKYLVMLNYEVDPGILEPYVPSGTELDTFDGRTFASMVGFLFHDTRLLGLPIPFHRNFEEINLRFYVRSEAEDGRRRGVVFVKEIVPRFAIACVARTLYGENYISVPTRNSVDMSASGHPEGIRYEWQFAGSWGGSPVD